MEKAIDPVCGMSVDPNEAAGQSKFEGKDYYFCSVACKTEFDNNPAKFGDADVDAADGAPRGADDPPYTKTGGMVSPKFGAAGSGGAEYEPLPGDDKDRI